MGDFTVALIPRQLATLFSQFVQKKKKKLEKYKKFHHGSPQVPPYGTSKRKTNQPVPIFVFATLCYTPPNEELENDAQPT